jgi:threonine dehydratase
MRLHTEHRGSPHGRAPRWSALRSAIDDADRRIRAQVGDSEGVRRTPLIRSPQLERELSCKRLRLKLECIQNSGSFKLRGATYAVERHHQRDESCVFVASSAGNHGLGLAVAAANRGHLCHVFMPTIAPLTKKLAIEKHATSIYLQGASFDETQQIAKEFAADRGYTYIHPFNDLDVVAGQGTIGLELVEQLQEVGEEPPDFLVVPCGGGGLLAGIATAVEDRWPATRIVAVEPQEVASLTAAFRQGSPRAIEGKSTIADGVAVAEIGDRVFPIIQDHVDASDVWTVPEELVATAIAKCVEEVRVVAEGAGALPLAGVMQRHATDPGLFDHKSVLLIVSGGNLDITALSKVLQRGLELQKRHTHLHFTVPDVPGKLAEVTKFLADLRLNLIDLRHTRNTDRAPFGYAEVDVVIETEGAEHAAAVEERIRAAHFRLSV